MQYIGFGLLASFPLIAMLLVVGAALFLGYTGANFWLWALLGAGTLWGFGGPTWLWIMLGLGAVIFGLPPVRRFVASLPVMKIIKALNLLPAISETEKTAIEAGNIWVDGELFSGKPNFKRLLNEPYPGLTPEEQAFLDGPVEEVCRMTNDWDVVQRRDLPPEVWEYLKTQKFFGIIVPKKYGGLQMSPSANSAVVAKLSSCCSTLAITVMVPNSLGPAELLIHYGTEAQKDYYLPRLATGEEMPCFALTEPGAGSDAGSITASGVVFRGQDGKLYLRLNWNKRYITLASIATVLGLAFKLKDPENLLGKGPELGITCALIPTKTAGVVCDMRHDPNGVPFYNCPTQGHDVVVPIDAIIGGPEQSGNGWRMLMESLAAGRGISLPGTATGGVKHMARVAGAYAAVRKQFGLSIGKFEGIEEPLAYIGGSAYFMEAARRYTNGGLDSGQKPPVVTAIMKYYITETCRTSLMHAMDILGGAAISRGPRNFIASGYAVSPVQITVEGANILTRTLMIFGQGAIRCHPHAFKEMTTLMKGDLAGFDTAFWKHVGHVVRNGSRALVLSLTRGWATMPGVGGPMAKYCRKLTWASASFAFLADFAMGRFGGDLKRMEKITGRFADIFAWMYMATATIRRFEAEGRRREDRAFAEWALQFAFSRMQDAFDGIYANIGFPFGGPIALWSRLNSIGSMPSDKLGHKIAAALQVPGEQRDNLTVGTYQPTDINEAIGRLENAFRLVTAAEPILKKIRTAAADKKIKKGKLDAMVKEAITAGIVSAQEARLLADAEDARNDAIQVDAFTQEEFMRTAHPAPKPFAEKPLDDQDVIPRRVKNLSNS